jgi:dipeptidyl aminopeptidase/acylaminoacyl peptidase
MGLDRATAPYGAWASPLSAAAVAAAGRTVVDLLPLPAASPFTHAWIEARPDEGGRQVIVAATAGCRHELPAPWSARSRVHEYGGGAAIAIGDGFVFTDFRSGGLCRFSPLAADAATVVQVLATHRDQRFADFAWDAVRNRLLAVCERHAGGGVDNLLVAIDASGSLSTLVDGHDFFAAPTLSADAARLAFLAWDHPHMPWDAATLYLAELTGDDGRIRPGSVRRIAGGDGSSCLQPSWHDDVLLFVAERAGYWNLHAATASGARCLHADAAEYGRPPWSLGSRSYAVLATPHGPRIACERIEDGVASLAEIDVHSGVRRALPGPFCGYRQLLAAADGRHLHCIAERTTAPPAIVAIDVEAAAASPVMSPAASAGGTTVADGPAVAAGGPAAAMPAAHGAAAPPDIKPGAQPGFRILETPPAAPLPDDWISVGQRIRFATTGGAVAHAIFYAPCNPRWQAPPGARPPLLVTTHGGPTGSAGSGLSLRTQYYTSRGFAVVDVDYRGSSGYGRAYRDALIGQWGVHDVDDAVAAVDYLVAAGLVDAQRVAIRGGSAGGFTTLSALAFRDRFRAGASHYGIGDLELLARDTHKFEAHYLDHLVGRLPQDAATYRARSPLHHADGFTCPVLFLQGLEDRVVPPNQAEAMVSALDRRRIPVALLTFPDEGHGFRKAASIVAALEAEYAFFARIFGIEPAEPLPRLHIRNLD